MACGCADNACNCVVQGINGLTVTGSGSVIDPYLISAGAETTFAATNTGGGIDITPAGTAGHTPQIELVLDPASPALLSQGVDGLSVACCVIPGGEGGDFVAGMMMDWAGPAEPSGWVFADGSSYAEGDLPVLFAVIGTTYGSVGAGFFNVPDTRGRVTVALDDMGGADAGRLSVANLLGGTGGVDAVALSIAEMPSHNHPGSSFPGGVFTGTGNTNFFYNENCIYTGGGAQCAVTGIQTLSGTDGPVQDAIENLAISVSGAVTVAAQGGGGAHTNLQPYILVNKIIKT